jgi:hypothetical protein
MTPAMSDSVLVSFAILNTNWEQRGRSFVDNFVPFVADCLRRSSQREIAVPEVRACLLESFSLDLPAHVIQTLLARGKKVGIVTQQGRLLMRVDKEVKRFDLDEVRAQVAREYEALLSAFADYCAEEFGEEISVDDADLLLMGYVERRSLPVLQEMLGREAKAEAVQPVEGDYLVASFIAHVCEAEPILFGFLERVIKGSMLATALYLPESGAMGRISDLRVVLDTPFLLKALGYEGEAHASASRELTEQLRKMGARLVCLSGTLKEMQGVLDACAGQLRAPRRRREVVMPLVDYCLNNGLSASDVDVLIERLEEDMRSIGVRVIHPPPVTTELSVDEVQLDEVLQLSVGYLREKARRHDLEALTAVFRMRHGEEQRRLENARAIFVTTNGRLVGASREFFREPARGDLVPIAAVAHELGTVVWLKSPVRAPQLPAKLIVADAYAALNPPDETWKKYLDAVERLLASEAISEDDYTILRYSVEARRALMHVTHGRSDAFVVGSLDEILRQARTAAAQELSDQLRQARALLEEEREQHSKAEAEARQRGQAVAAQKELGKRRERALRRSQRRRIEARAEAIAATVARGLYAVVGLSAVAAVYVALPEPFPDLIGGLPRVATLALGGLIVFGAILSMAGLVGGESAASLTARTEALLARRLKKVFVAWFMSDSDGEEPKTG